MPEPAGEAELVRQALAGRVAVDLAHEINGLLVGVLSVATDAMDAGTTAELRRAAATNAEYGRRIAELVRGFQEAFGCVGCDGPAATDLSAALERSLLLCRKTLRSAEIEVRRDYGNLPGVEAKVGLLEQVFLELFHTAIGAMPNGGVLGVTGEAAGEAVAVTVSHTDPPLADAGRLLGPASPMFAGDCTTAPDARVKSVRSFRLAVARAAVRRLGGDLTAQCTLGKGSQFTVTLPVLGQNDAPPRPS